MDELEVHLRALPDDWASWLVYADVLEGRGDPLGEILVLAHRAETDPAAGSDLEALQDAWLEMHEGELLYEDRHHLETLRTLRPLAGSPAPPDLAPVFGRPLCQLFPFLEREPRGYDRASPIVALQRERVIAACDAWIERAFDGVPAPDEAHRTIHQAEAADNYDRCDRSRDHVGRWQELPDEHLRANQWALPHLDEQGMRYYLPAVMRFDLRGGEGWITESLAYTLQCARPELRDYQRSQLALLDREQRAAIYAFALVSGNTAAARSWAHVYERERIAAREDWFELFSR